MSTLPSELLLEIFQRTSLLTLWSLRSCSKQFKICAEDTARTAFLPMTTITLSVSLGSGSHHRWYDVRAGLIFQFSHLEDNNTTQVTYRLHHVRPDLCGPQALEKWKHMRVERPHDVEIWRVELGDAHASMPLQQLRVEHVDGSVEISFDWHAVMQRFARDFEREPDYIYPYLSRNSSFTIGASYPTASSVVSAPGTPGGAPGLSVQIARVATAIINTGSLDAQIVAQLYLALGNGEPRGFNKTVIAAGESTDVSISLAGRDVSIWDIPLQSWVDMRTLRTEIAVFVGASSRNLPLDGILPGLAGQTTSASAYGTSRAAPASKVVSEKGDGQVVATVVLIDGG